MTCCIAPPLTMCAAPGDSIFQFFTPSRLGEHRLWFTSAFTLAVFTVFFFCIGEFPGVLPAQLAAAARPGALPARRAPAPARLWARPDDALDRAWGAPQRAQRGLGSGCQSAYCIAAHGAACLRALSGRTYLSHTAC